MKNKAERKERVRGFDKRLKELVGEGSVSAFAQKCGLTESLVRRYLSGDSLPVIDVLATFADVLRVNVEWLATGNGPMWRGAGPGGVLEVNLDLLTNVIEAVEESIAKKQVNVRAPKKAQLVAILYDLARKEGKGMEPDRDMVFRLVQLGLED